MPTPAHHNALHPVVLRLAGMTFEGFSISGLATWIIVPELDAMFDAGECPIQAVDINHVFLSHGHADHSNGLLRHWQIRQMQNRSAADYYVPAETVNGFEARVRAEALLGDEEEHSYKEQYPNLFVLPPDRSRRSFKKGLWVETFSVEHRAPSVGYTIGRTVQKLRAEYETLSGPEIGALRKSGTVITDPVDTALVTFIGDCTGESLAANTHIFKSKVVIIECTHVDDDQRERTAKYGHTHLRDIVDALNAVGDAPECEAVILKHFSLKESPEHIRARVAELIPSAWASRVHVLLPPPV